MDVRCDGRSGYFDSQNLKQHFVIGTKDEDVPEALIGKDAGICCFQETKTDAKDERKRI